MPPVADLLPLEQRRNPTPPAAFAVPHRLGRHGPDYFRWLVGLIFTANAILVRQARPARAYLITAALRAPRLNERFLNRPANSHRHPVCSRADDPLRACAISSREFGCSAAYELTCRSTRTTAVPPLLDLRKRAASASWTQPRPSKPSSRGDRHHQPQHLGAREQLCDDAGAYRHGLLLKREVGIGGCAGPRQQDIGKRTEAARRKRRGVDLR